MDNHQQNFKDLAKEYACGNININQVVRFKKNINEAPSSYQTLKGAFIFPISGQCKIHLSNQVYDAKPGILIHGCPQEQLLFEVVGDEPFEYINLYYDCVNNIKLAIQLDSYERIIDILCELLELHKKNNLRAIYRKEQLYDKLFELMFHGFIRNKIRTNQQLIKEVEAYIHNNYEKALSLTSLADYAGKKPHQFSYLFHLYTGIRPIDYLIRCRLEHAIDLLNEDIYTVQEVASMVGYSDSLYFSRLFKKHIGQAPSKFRNT